MCDIDCFLQSQVFLSNLSRQICKYFFYKYIFLLSPTGYYLYVSQICNSILCETVLPLLEI